MIMTKDKVRELNALAGRHTTETLPQDGAYAVSATQDAFELRRMSESGGADFFVMGMVIPAHKAAAVCQLLQDDQGMMPSPVIMLKKSDKATAPGRHVPLAATRHAGHRESDTRHDESSIRVKNIEIIPGRHEVKVNGKSVSLTFSEFRILQTLASKPGWVFSREHIIHAVHGNNYNCTERAVDVQVTGLRKKIGDAGEHIETVRGVGYRFAE